MQTRNPDNLPRSRKAVKSKDLQGVKHKNDILIFWNRGLKFQEAKKYT
jgi:hypothetical protein